MILTIDHVSKRYKNKYALKDFSATFTEGVYGLLGPNGAGKTTLISIIIGILHPTGGRILYNGVPTEQMGLDFVSKIGYLPQYPAFYKDFRAREFLEYMCAVKDIPKVTGKKRIAELLTMVNLTEEAEKKIGSYSGGMRQRLGIAQAMLNDPAILILDEPTAGLDPKERIRFRNIISKLSSERIVILATHIVSDIEYIANEVVLLKKGELLYQQKPDDLLDGIQNKVWSVCVDNDRIDSFMDQYSISNIQHSDNQYKLRIVSDQPPVEGAETIPPNLEDAFLYYMGEETL